MKFSTNNENKLITSIQRKVGAYENGVIGTQTLSDIAVRLGADCFPLTLSMYGFPVIVAKDLIAWSPKAPLNGFKNSMLGSFTYPRASVPCSILVNDGRTISGNACHSFAGNPETVVYKMQDGAFGVKKCKYASELPKGVKWAIGGMGLLNMYNPEEEGFIGKFADVHRKTNHNVLGVKNGMVYGVYYKNMNTNQINEHCKNKMKFDMAVLLDGGGLAAMNGTERFAQINTGCKQGYAIQFV